MMKSSSSLDESNYPSYSTSSSEASCSEEFLLASEQPKKKAGRRKFKETRHPVYRGIRRRNNNKWVCEVRVPNDKSTRIWLGTYPTPEMAARAHDVAALALRGKSACLNFADSAWRLTLPVSTDPKEIRKMAAEAALAFAVEDVPELEQDMLHDWIRNMADEPLQSPACSFIRSYDRDHWNNVDVDVEEVSLWSFTI
ncbi:unnamed protein product [Trifolium pratense]|uniref:Uncharacterized protein n=1 Tax=Trifolium pratense TaxID=57577 RepID=A0ACB0L5T2_TRIPR|nr:unnamed protein product [Trifolium pratense]